MLGWLRDILDLETIYKVYDNISFPEQSWLQFIYYAVCLLHGHNFKRWNKVWRKLLMVVYHQRTSGIKFNLNIWYWEHILSSDIKMCEWLRFGVLIWSPFIKNSKIYKLYSYGPSSDITCIVVVQVLTRSLSDY